MKGEKMKATMATEVTIIESTKFLLSTELKELEKKGVILLASELLDISADELKKII